MPNSYFSFKQFKVNQNQCAMKVCTDACLFGAWAVNQIQKENFASNQVLDIGAGTGLLSLILAQKVEGIIDAVEVDPSAANQAKENFEASPWSDRLTVHHGSIQQFTSSHFAGNIFNIIISNPPFFEASLKSRNQQKNLAKHNSSLSYNDLCKAVINNLAIDGVFFILLPYEEFQSFVTEATDRHLFLSKQLNVKQSPSHNYFRSIGIFSREKLVAPTTSSIAIKDEKNNYTQEFVELLKDYYLYL